MDLMTSESCIALWVVEPEFEFEKSAQLEGLCCT